MQGQLEELRSSIDLTSYIAPLSGRRPRAVLSPCISESAMSPCPDSTPAAARGDIPGEDAVRLAGPTVLYCDPLAACEAEQARENRHAEELRAALRAADALRESMAQASEDHEKRVRRPLCVCFFSRVRAYFFLERFCFPSPWVISASHDRPGPGCFC